MNGIIQIELDIIQLGIVLKILALCCARYDKRIAGFVFVMILQGILDLCLIFGVVVGLWILHEAAQLIVYHLISFAEVFDEDEGEDKVLIVILRDSAAEFVGGVPEFFFEVDGGGGHGW